jgi:hypothetical protein
VNAAPEPVLLALPGMTPAAVREILRLREGGVFPANLNQLLNMIPSAAGATLDAERQQLNRRTIFRTDEVEIISDGHVEGSSVEARVRLIVVRSEEGALVVTRVFN